MSYLSYRISGIDLCVFNGFSLFGIILYDWCILDTYCTVSLGLITWTQRLKHMTIIFHYAFTTKPLIQNYMDTSMNSFNNMTILIMLITYWEVLLFSFLSFFTTVMYRSPCTRLDYPTGCYILSPIQLPGNFIHKNLGWSKEIIQLFLPPLGFKPWPAMIFIPASWPLSLTLGCAENVLL